MIRRGPRPERGFTVISNDILRHPDLSLRARGLLALLLSRPDNWRIGSSALAREVKEGREAVRAALAEIEAAGYLTRQRYQDERGHWRQEAVVHETPQVSDIPAGHTEDGFPGAGFPGAGFPGADRTTDTKDREVPGTNVPGGTCGDAEQLSMIDEAPTPVVQESVGTRANRLTKAYVDRQPMANFPAIAAIVRRAIAAGHDDQPIVDALLRLAEDRRSVTVDSLRVELEGPPVVRDRPTNADLRRARSQAIIEKIKARQGQEGDS